MQWNITKLLRQNLIMKCEDKWIELDTIIWSMVTQIPRDKHMIQKDKCFFFSLIVNVSFDSLDMGVPFGISMERICCYLRF